MLSSSADRSSPSASQSTVPGAGERILVVDDEPDIVALVAYHLAKLGYRVSTAGTGTDALELARRERPALMVLDLMLPDLSGFEVLEQLRADEARTRGGTGLGLAIAAAIATAHGGTAHAANREVGADVWISLPL